MDFKASMKSITNKLRKIKQRNFSSVDSSHSTIDDPISAPRLRSLPTPISEYDASPETTGRPQNVFRRAIKHMHLNKSKASRSRVVVSPDAIASIPPSVSAIRKHRWLPGPEETAEDVEEGFAASLNASLDEVAFSATIQDRHHGSHSSCEENRQDEEAERDIETLIDGEVLVPRTFPAAISRQPIASTMLQTDQASDHSSSAFELSQQQLMDHTRSQVPEQSPLDADYGALIRYSKGSGSKTQATAAAVRDLSEARQWRIEYPTPQASNELERDIAPVGEIKALKAAHREEIEELKSKHSDHLQIYSKDLQDEKARTLKANGRAGKANKQLQASRIQRQILEKELNAEKRESAEQQVKADQWNDIQFNEIRRLKEELHRKTTELNLSSVTNQKLLADVTQYQISNQQRNDQLQEQQTTNREIWGELQLQYGNVNGLTTQLKAFQHQLQLAIGEKGQILQQKARAEAELEKQRVINRALMRDRADGYVELPQDDTLFQSFRPNELADVEQALLTSQSLHEKAEADAIALRNELSEECEAKADLEKQLEQLQALADRYKYEALHENKCEEATYTILARSLAGEMPETSEQLHLATQSHLVSQAALRHAIGDAMEENELLRSENLALEKQLALQVKQHETEIQDIRQQNEALHNEVLGNALETRELKKVAILYRNSCKQIHRNQAEIKVLQRKLALKVIKPLESQLWDNLQIEVGELRRDVQGLNQTIFDQELHMHVHGQQLHEAKERYNRRFANVMEVFYARDRYHAILTAVLDRFGAQLQADPLVVDVTDFMLLLNEYERQRFLQFPPHISKSSMPSVKARAGLPTTSWVNVTFDAVRLQQGPERAAAASFNTALGEKMKAAVDEAATDRRERELDMVRDQQVQFDLETATIEELNRQDKERVYIDRQHEVQENERQNAETEAQVSTLLPRMRERADWNNLSPEEYFQGREVDINELEAAEGSSNFGDAYDDLPAPMDIKQEPAGEDCGQQTIASVQNAADPYEGNAYAPNANNGILYQQNPNQMLNPYAGRPYAGAPPMLNSYGGNAAALNAYGRNPYDAAPAEENAPAPVVGWTWEKPKVPAQPLPPHLHGGNTLQAPEDEDEDEVEDMYGDGGHYEQEGQQEHEQQDGQSKKEGMEGKQFDWDTDVF